jgi:hypothetical protein
VSAFICSDITTNALAQLAPLEFGSRQQVADILRAENTRAVNYRYEEQAEPDPIEFEPSDYVAKMGSVAIVKLCDHFDCQACQTDDYDDTLAAQIIESIRRAALERAADELLVEQDRLLDRGTNATPDERRRLLPRKKLLTVFERGNDWDQLVREARSVEFNAAPWGL